MIRPLIIFLPLALSGASPAEAAPAASAGGYLGAVKPVLQERCYACHGALKQEAGLRLDTAERIRSGGDDGPVVAPGEPDLSKLLARVTNPDPDHRMPPEGKALDPATIEAVRAWIAAGAPAPADEKADDDPRDHWALQRIVRPEPPASEHANPIDAFLAAKLDALQLRPAPPAARPLVLRRLYLDLLGLPPTPAQLADSRPVSTIADELLESAHHVERWGRHWMDVWRYSDWYGLDQQLRHSQKHLWHWRDWIVNSLNADKGYDRMVLEMLAGDELAPDDTEAITATGFLARNYYLFNRTTWLDSTIEHTSKAFLGLTLDCAKCHDHKYDPLTHLDYYRFRAVFEPHQIRLDPVPGQTDLDADGLPRAFDADTDPTTYLHRRGDPDDPDTSTKIAPGVPALLASFAPDPEPVRLPYLAHSPGAREYVRRDHLAAAARALGEAEAALAEAALAEAVEREEAASRAAGSPAPDFDLHEEFDAPDDTRWEIGGSDWEFRDGALHKTVPDREGHVALLRAAPPRDFELVARFTTTGGTTYRSVAFRFDSSEDGLTYHQVYASAHEPDPKVQIAHTSDGDTTYPASGRVVRPVALNHPYTLRIAVRDQLINVWLDDEFLLAYRLPNPRITGAIALSAFDATAAFHHLSVRALPAEAALTEPDTPDAGPPPADLARASVSWRRAQLDALQAVDAAEAARLAGAPDFPDRARAAARAQAEERLASATHDLAAAEPDKREAAEERIEMAEQALVDCLQEAPADYAPIHASRQALETPEHTFDDYPASYPDHSSGRRLALAKWIVHPDNPLAARVAANHVWLRHFGSSLTESVFDFGRRTPRPEHAELLDWLAAELIDSGWSLKHLHRLMVTSEAYGRSSSNGDADPPTLAADPTNALYWRANPRRMESQVVRDSILHLAGTLDLTVGGPSLAPDADSRRRSLYFQHSRDQQDKFLSMFDDADHLQCYRRTESIVPQQALALANSKLSLDSAARIAERIAERVPGQDDAFLTAAFEEILCRAPDSAELQACREFLTSLSDLVADLDEAARPSRLRAQLVHALLNHNGFVTIR
ncbi:hypothetical protein BH23VER1_BH23VER1_21280 [soil metagenome]